MKYKLSWCVCWFEGCNYYEMRFAYYDDALDFYNNSLVIEYRDNVHLMKVY